MKHIAPIESIENVEESLGKELRNLLSFNKFNIRLKAMIIYLKEENTTSKRILKKDTKY